MEKAVSQALDSGLRTADIAPQGATPVGTKAMADAVIAAL